jgi:hypothetical protein
MHFKTYVEMCAHLPPYITKLYIPAWPSWNFFASFLFERVEASLANLLYMYLYSVTNFRELFQFRSLIVQSSVPSHQWSLNSKVFIYVLQIKLKIFGKSAEPE